MLLQDVEFDVRELTRLAEYAVGDADLAEVMSDRRLADCLGFSVGKTNGSCNLGGVALYAHEVLACEGVARLAVRRHLRDELFMRF